MVWTRFAGTDEPAQSPSLLKQVHRQQSSISLTSEAWIEMFIHSRDTMKKTQPECYQKLGNKLSEQFAGLERQNYFISSVGCMENSHQSMHAQ